MIHPDQIQPDMPVVCSENAQFATVDHMEGTNNIKLRKDDAGQHHYIPLCWISSIEDGKVKVNRPANQAVKEWSTVSPMF